MRKFLLIIFILILCVAIYFLIFESIPGNYVHSYKDLRNTYDEYNDSIEQLESKEENDFSIVQDKLKESANEDEEVESVIKQYEESKKKYEKALKEKNVVASTSNGEALNFETISGQIGQIASSNNLDLKIDVNKSDYDVVSNENETICDLDFEITGRYTAITQFLDSIDSDSTLGISISNFFMEEFNKDSEKNASKSLTEEDLKVRVSFKSCNMTFEKDSIKE